MPRASAQEKHFAFPIAPRFRGGSDGKRISLQCRRPWFDPWVGKIPCGREGLPTPVVLPGEFHGQRSLVGYSLQGCKEWTQLSYQHFFPSSVPNCSLSCSCPNANCTFSISDRAALCFWVISSGHPYGFSSELASKC